MALNERKSLLLHAIIKEHIATGAPVGSSSLVEKYKLGVSPATVRNDMASLEDEGYIAQPHRSAGRVPTERAYAHYIDNLKLIHPEDEEVESISVSISEADSGNFKNAAKLLSQISDNAVFWAFHKNSLFYTGISNLFQQPEFRQVDDIYDVSAVIDRMDEIIENIFDEFEVGEHVSIGSQNPFSPVCSSIIAKYRHGNKLGMFGILGPMRMDYARNIALVKIINEQINGN